MIQSSAIQVILDDSSFHEAISDLTKLNMDIIANSDVTEKEIREVCYMKVKVINEIMAHLQSIADGKKIKDNKWKIQQACRLTWAKTLQDLICNESTKTHKINPYKSMTQKGTNYWSIQTKTEIDS